MTSPIVHIINNSMDKEIFPDNWKIARVCPIPKVAQSTECKRLQTYFDTTNIVKSLRKGNFATTIEIH